LETRSACTACDAEGVPWGTDAIRQDTPAQIRRQLAFSAPAEPSETCPSRNSPSRAARRRRQCPQARPCAGSKRSEEHCRRRARHETPTRDGAGAQLAAHPPGMRTDSSGGLSGETEPRTMAHGWRVFLPKSTAQTMTRGTASEGVNDPASRGWGHPQVTAPGSFTPSLVHRLRHELRR
jgi:hypothetical protein